MANEILATAVLSFAKGSFAEELRKVSKQFNMAGEHFIHDILDVTTGALAIPLGSVVTPGWGFFYNDDASNFVKIRMGVAGADVVKLKKKEFAMFRLASTNPYAIADTATCKMEYIIIED